MLYHLFRKTGLRSLYLRFRPDRTPTRQQARELLDTFVDWDGDSGPSPDYVVGYAHGLFNAGLIDGDRWRAVTDWASAREGVRDAD